MKLSKNWPAARMAYKKLLDLHDLTVFQRDFASKHLAAMEEPLNIMWYFIRDKKSRDFFRFWFAQLISQFGDRVYQMALVGLMTVRYIRDR